MRRRRYVHAEAHLRTVLGGDKNRDRVEGLVGGEDDLARIVLRFNGGGVMALHLHLRSAVVGGYGKGTKINSRLS